MGRRPTVLCLVALGCVGLRTLKERRKKKRGHEAAAASKSPEARWKRKLKAIKRRVKNKAKILLAFYYLAGIATSTTCG